MIEEEQAAFTSDGQLATPEAEEAMAGLIHLFMSTIPLRYEREIVEPEMQKPEVRIDYVRTHPVIAPILASLQPSDEGDPPTDFEKLQDSSEARKFLCKTLKQNITDLATAVTNVSGLLLDGVLTENKEWFMFKDLDNGSDSAYTVVIDQSSDIPSRTSINGKNFSMYISTGIYLFIPNFRVGLHLEYNSNGDTLLYKFRDEAQSMREITSPFTGNNSQLTAQQLYILNAYIQIMNRYLLHPETIPISPYRDFIAPLRSKVDQVRYDDYSRE